MNVRAHVYESQLLGIYRPLLRVKLDQRSFDTIANDAKSHAGQVITAYSDFRNQTHRCGRRYCTVLYLVESDPGSGVSME